MSNARWDKARARLQLKYHGMNRVPMDFQLPELGEGVYEAELVEWKVEPGQTVRRGDLLAEVTTDKATMELPSPFAGRIASLAVKPGEEMKVGQVILAYEPVTAGEANHVEDAAATQREANGHGTLATEAGSAANYEAAGATADAEAPSSASAHDTGTVPPAAPSVRHMARQLGIDLRHVTGSGPGGRILIEDLGRMVPSATRAEPEPRVDPLAELRPAMGKAGSRIPLRGVRRAIAERMVHSKHTAPHYSYVDECDVTEMVRLRAGLKDVFDRQGIRLTYVAFAVHAVSRALVEVPIVNASLDDEREEIILHEERNIGVAVATSTGLIVPVIRHADTLSLGEIAAEIQRLSTKARQGKCDREELLGGTFTVTSIGNIGGLISTPILNHPQVGIMGLGKIVRRPVYDAAGQIVPADMLYLSYSFDHRVVDGALGAAFGNEVSRRLKHPAAMLVE
jgi:pyruvate/2-oxoglutarate dehydrogenase complex dihydrolipoamide acyltransferase (E2) component